MRDLYVDLGTSRLLAADKGEVKIAVEVKGFPGPGTVADLEQAIGQYTVYHDVLSTLEADRTLYLAVSEAVYEDAFQDPLGQLLLSRGRAKLLVYSEEREVICRWTPAPPTVP